MSAPLLIPSRRLFLGAMASALATPAFARADDLFLTPRLTEGPFYPDRLPLDTDNDLLIINGRPSKALGTITHLTGRVLDRSGRPVRNALVEIWQVDNSGAYLHSGSANRESSDTNFQGFGRFLTSSTGEYYFRTIKPVPYPGRAPHIHFKVVRGGRDILVTQCHIKGDPRNERDGVLRGLRDSKAREAVMVDFVPIKESKVGEVSAHFDIILGVTPETE
ncbi:MAG TPA: protocatechuate 3,4-dioxygenase [Gemmatales bacterium]|nr:protocatechuate 3,4-dioxygenase [Gemmatales bacterium]HMP58159.1 protocatechuate 3,4-dioxygenase [Gemmatales bacterium]